MSDNIIGNSVSGYTITSCIEHNDVRFVLAENSVKGDFATWMSQGEGDYFWGHYFSKYDDALRDLLCRVKDAWNIKCGNRKREC